MVNNAWLVGAVVLAGCSGRGNGPAELQGVVELHERQLGFDVQGRLAQLYVQRGQRVEAGQLLAALDDALQRPVRDARAQDAEAAQAQLDLLRSGTREEDVLATEAQLRGARAAESTANEQLQRSRRLRQTGVVPQAQLDDAEAQAARARSERESLEQRLTAQKNGARASELRQAKARVDSARAALAAEEARLARSVLRAPAARTSTCSSPSRTSPASGSARPRRCASTRRARPSTGPSPTWRAPPSSPPAISSALASAPTWWCASGST